MRGRRRTTRAHVAAQVDPHLQNIKPPQIPAVAFLFDTRAKFSLNNWRCLWARLLLSAADAENQPGLPLVVLFLSVVFFCFIPPLLILLFFLFDIHLPRNHGWKLALLHIEKKVKIVCKHVAFQRKKTERRKWAFLFGCFLSVKVKGQTPQNWQHQGNLQFTENRQFTEKMNK